MVGEEADLRRLNTEVLLESGYHVDAANDSAAAWQALHAGRYDLMIADHQMPNVSSVELIKKIQDAGMKLPVIMASATLPENELMSRSWRKFVVLLKPYSLVELVGTVGTVLASNRNGG